VALNSRTRKVKIPSTIFMENSWTDQRLALLGPACPSELLRRDGKRANNVHGSIVLLITQPAKIRKSFCSESAALAKGIYGWSRL
jgi:hypothetical protein